MDFTAIDFETAQYSPDSACSIGLVKFKDSKPAESYYSLIRPPELYIRPDFTDIHGLTVDDVRDAPTFGKIWENAVLPFMEDLPLVAHNASFDMHVLHAVLTRYDCAIPKRKYFCSLEISRKVWRQLASHALTSLGKTFGIAYNAHDALDDARVCGTIVCMAAQQTGAQNLRELLRFTGVRMKRLDALQTRLKPR